jgi:hypothetical protein
MYNLTIWKSYSPENINKTNLKEKQLIKILKEEFGKDSLNISILRNTLKEECVVGALIDIEGVQINIVILKNDIEFDNLSPLEIIKENYGEKDITNHSIVISFINREVVGTRLKIEGKFKDVSIIKDDNIGEDLITEEEYESIIYRDSRNNNKYRLKLILENGEEINQDELTLIDLVNLSNITTSYITPQFIVYLLNELKKEKDIGTKIVAAGIKDDKSFDIECTIYRSFK